MVTIHGGINMSLINLELLKKFYNFIISLGSHFSALSDHIEGVKLLGQIQIFLHMFWIVFIMIIIGFIVWVLKRFKILFCIFYSFGWIIYKIISLFIPKKLSYQEQYYKNLAFKKNTNQFYKKPVSYYSRSVQKKSSHKIPYDQYKQIEKYVLNKHRMNKKS
jgi:hypothetical protein